MKAAVGDRIVIGGTRINGMRLCKVLDVRSEYGPAAYLVRWDDTGEVGLLLPGAEDEVVLPRVLGHRPATAGSTQFRNSATHAPRRVPDRGPRRPS
ncbi:MAG: DUF1918 domain-containing protein [Acidimicrobiales bacterium]|jgi:hypothetical protein